MGRNQLDDAMHVLLYCPRHWSERRDMVQEVNAQLTAAAMLAQHARWRVCRLQELNGDQQRAALLLGTPPLEHLQSPESEHYVCILRAVSKFLRKVYRTRWIQG